MVMWMWSVKGGRNYDVFVEISAYFYVKYLATILLLDTPSKKSWARWKISVIRQRSDRG